ncbi:helix-turn-helix domain-containing protein [Psychromonas ossibalaenae]|uniref:helix-turn-helix domain-containing protein n=1 Tax=Psychromonas ossibalaenae TaxID=444922 RepID=UPI000376FA7A|nr:AraC family transcriptional regulator [Psychromonas ossibalaenae]
MSRRYALSRACIALPFLNIMKQHGKDPQIVLAQLGLGKQDFENKQLYLPAYSLGHILDSSAQLTKSVDLGFVLGCSDEMMDIHPQLMELIEQKETLLDCLVTLAQLQYLQGSHFGFELEYVNSELRIYHSSALLSSNRGFKHSHLFTTARIIKFLKQYKGAEWKPDYIALEPNISDTSQLAKNTRMGRVLCCMDRSYIPVTYNLDAARIPLPNYSPNLSIKALQQIKVVVNALWRLENFNLDLLSHLFGLSERTIQRLFSDDGSSFRDYLNNIKINKAKQLLLQGSSVNKVAEQLHYTEPANLTRAMKKQIGLTPMQYINQYK